MKSKLALFLSTASLLHAGSPEPEPTAVVKADPWIKPIIDIRARYEYADVDGKDQSNALTFRERVGFETMKWHGFSMLAEGEFTEVAVADYNAAAGPDAYPSDTANSVIADPRNAELNRAYLQYEGFDTTGQVGRERIIYDNQAFIGNVGWRQNEQTFDGITLENKSLDDFTFKYAYISQVNRIFGEEADSPLVAVPPTATTPAVIFDNVTSIDASTNLFNGSYTGFENLTLGGYAYVMSFDDKENWDNNTFGMIATGDVLGLTLYGELAWQDQAGFNTGEDAFYFHAIATKKFMDQSISIGVEQLYEGFKTPLATVHAFNGWADAFIGGRTEGNHNGLTDVYVSHTIPLFWGVKWTNVFHMFGENQVSTGYGWEYDSLLAKKFNDNFLAIAKFAMFESEGDAFIVNGTALPDTTRFSIELNYTF